MRLQQQLTSILLRRPNMPFSSCSHKCSHPRPVIRVFRSYISTSEWQARQSMIEHEQKAGRINPSGSEMNFRGLSSRGNHKSYHFSAENSLRTGTKQWPRPAAIPWQPKMANTVHLIGTVSAPVEFIHMSQGKIRAATMLLRKSPSPSQCLGIRLIFEDDLAENAAYHLKQNDWIYVSGWLDVESQCSTNEKKQFITQVVVNNLNFVQQDFQLLPK